MERLTFRHDCPGLNFDGRAEPCEPVNCLDDYSKAALDAVVSRLADYEDTGLEPEEIATVMLLAEKTDTVDLVRENLRIANRLRHAEADLKGMAALVKAREEGRVHIDPPPAKEGDPKPSCFYQDGGTIWCLGLAPNDADEPCDRCKACWYCESGDYADARAEAEAAHEGGVK